MQTHSSSSQIRSILPIIFLGLGLILIAVAGYFIFKNNTPQTDLSVVPAKINRPAPEVTLTDTDGISHSLADYHGQVVLVNLWATWCPPCQEEMPALQSFYDQYKEKGFVVIAINDGDPKADVVKFVADYKLSFPVWLDPTYFSTEQAFKTLNLPSSYVIDRSGMMRLSWVGGIDSKTLNKYVTPIIKEQ